MPGNDELQVEDFTLSGSTANLTQQRVRKPQEILNRASKQYETGTQSIDNQWNMEMADLQQQAGSFKQAQQAKVQQIKHGVVSQMRANNLEKQS